MANIPNLSRSVIKLCEDANEKFDNSVTYKICGDKKEPVILWRDKSSGAEILCSIYKALGGIEIINSGLQEKGLPRTKMEERYRELKRKKDFITNKILI